MYHTFFWGKSKGVNFEHLENLGLFKNGKMGKFLFSLLIAPKAQTFPRGEGGPAKPGRKRNGGS